MAEIDVAKETAGTSRGDIALYESAFGLQLVPKTFFPVLAFLSLLL
jgi:hypothetical protein